jgi:ComF family protein
LYAARERQRGYNQAALLANGIAGVVQKPLLPHVLERSMQVSSQTRKNRTDRWANVSRVFTVKKPGDLQGRHVLLVDDVITTGATTEACSRALLAAQATVSICSLAFTSI